MTLPSQAIVSGSSVLVALALIALSVIIKYFVERGREQLAFLGPGSYTYQERVAHSRKYRLASQIYRCSFHLRPVLALLLLIMPSVAGIGLALSFVAEMYVLFRYHLVLLTAMSLTLSSVAVSVGAWKLPLLAWDHSAMYDAPGVPFVQVLLAAMYGLSAVRKWRNGFANGRVLEYGIDVSLSQRKFKDHIWMSDTLLSFANGHCNWPIIAKGVIVGELLIGCLLLLPGTIFNVIGVLLAAVAQASFAMLFPRTLLPFTLAVFASLLLWL